MRRRNFLKSVLFAPAPVFTGTLPSLRGSSLLGASTEEQAPVTIKVAGIVARWVKDVDDYREVNYRRVETLIREAAVSGAKVACTSECFLDGYYREVTDQRADLTEMAERCEVIETSRYIKKLATLAQELDIAIVAGMAIREGEQLSNTAQLYTPGGGLLGLYRKTHNFGRHSGWFARQSDVDRSRSFPSFDLGLGVGRAGLMICNDRNFEHTSFELARNGSQLIFCPTGGGYDFARLAEHCSRVGLWSLWVHPLGVAIIDWRGRTVVHRKNPLNDDSLAVPATEIDSSGDRRFIVIGEVELRSPILTHPPGSCPGDEYWISSRKLNE